MQASCYGMGSISQQGENPRIFERRFLGFGFVVIVAAAAVASSESCCLLALLLQDVGWTVAFRHVCCFCME